MSTLEYQQVHEAATIRAGSHPSPQDVEDIAQKTVAEIKGYANADSVKVTLNRIRKKIKDGSDAAGLETRWEEHSRPY